MEEFAVIGIDMSIVSLTKMHRAFDHGIENRRNVARRPVDRLQYFGGRSLLLQRLAQVISALAHSLSSRAFSMAMTAWAAKFLTNSICLSVNGRTSWR